MKAIAMKPAAAAVLFSLAMVSAQASDRVRAGQWETTMGDGARQHVMKSCVSAADAAVMNSDERALHAHMQKAFAGTACTVKSLKVSGNVVVADNVCSGKAFTSTTTYHGDTYEQTSSLGTKTSSRRVGDCPKP